MQVEASKEAAVAPTLIVVALVVAATVELAVEWVTALPVRLRRNLHRNCLVLKLSLVALASSLAQGLTAILLVAAGLWVLGLGREQMTDTADQIFAPLSFAAIAVIGLWLVWRGGRGVEATARRGGGGRRWGWE